MGVNGLLTDDPISGPVGVKRLVTLQRYAHLVNANSLDDAAALVRQLCDTWGGAFHLMVPVTPGSDEIPEPWLTLLRDTRPEGTAVRGLVDVEDWPRYGGSWLDEAGGMSPIEVIAASGHERDRMRIVRAANGLSLEDPWAVAYLGIRGVMPDVGVSTTNRNSRRLAPGTTYDELIRVDRDQPDPAGFADILEQLRDVTSLSPADLSCLQLPLRSPPGGSTFGERAFPIPLRFDRAREIGPNVVVVYRPGSVEDLCLLWHLRAVSTLSDGLPLAIPDTGSADDIVQALRYFVEQEAFSFMGLRETQCHLVSTSLDPARLDQLAMAAGEPWRVAEWTSLLQPSMECGPANSDVAVFDRGVATLTAVQPEERSIVEPAITGYGARLDLVVHPVGLPLPPIESLSTIPMLAQYRQGQVNVVSDRRDVIAVSWPTGLAVLRAAVRDRGLEMKPSEPGRLAEALLRSADDAGGIVPLLHLGAQNLIDRVSERHGMNWFKRKLREIHEVANDPPHDAEARLLGVEDRIRELAGPATSDEQHDITFSDVQHMVSDRTGAERWLAWAERAGLLLRGTRITCERCSNDSWRPMTDLAPPITCYGCGNAIQRPYGYAQLTFRYRATELLLQVGKADAVAHALALRFFTETFASHSNNSVCRIFGGYPGITFREIGRPDPVGEADVLLLLADGRVGIGECKTRAAGLNDAELEKLWTLGDRLGASFTFAATLDRSAACDSTWRRQPPKGDRPHYGLTAEHLLATTPISVMGFEPLAWREGFTDTLQPTPISDSDHNDRVLRALSEIDDWDRRGRTPWWQELPDHSETD